MCWNSNDHISLIDINADPFIEEIIKIPEEADPEGKELSYEVAAATVPFMDIEPYKKICKLSHKTRTPGISNFFKSKLKLEQSDVKSRLKRMHRVLKKAWYLEDHENTIEHLINSKDESKHLKIYQELFTIDFVADNDKFIIETPFTFVNWRQIEMLKMLCN